MKEKWTALVSASEELAASLDKVVPYVESVEATLEECVPIPAVVSVQLEGHFEGLYSLSYQRHRQKDKPTRWRLLVQKLEEVPDGVDPVGPPCLVHQTSVPVRLAALKAFPKLLDAMAVRLKLLNAEVADIVRDKTELAEAN